MILIKKHPDGILSVCDADLIGKNFEEGDMQLNITERFYKGEEASREEIIAAMEDAVTVNIVGEESVKLALEAGLIDEDSVKRVHGVPHAQIFSV